MVLLQARLIFTIDGTDLSSVLNLVLLFACRLCLCRGRWTLNVIFIDDIPACSYRIWTAVTLGSENSKWRYFPVQSSRISERALFFGMFWLQAKRKMYGSMSVEHWWNDTDRGNGRTGRQTCHSFTFSIEISHGLSSDKTHASTVRGRREKIKINLNYM